MKSFVLKLIITLSLMASIAYLAVQPVEAVPIESNQVEHFNDCLSLRDSIVELFMKIYAAANLFDVSEYIETHNDGVQVFNMLCTPMMSPLQEIE